MPQIKAAEKALRAGKKHAARNAIIKKKIRDLRKKADKFLKAQKADEALKIFNELQVVLDKASKQSGFIKKNTAARYKSQLRKRIYAVGKK